MNNRNALRLACYVADANVVDYEKEDICYLVEAVGKETATDFYVFYGRKYGIDVDKQLAWIAEEE